MYRVTVSSSHAPLILIYLPRGMEDFVRYGRDLNHRLFAHQWGLLPTFEIHLIRSELMTSRKKNLGQTLIDDLGTRKCALGTTGCIQHEGDKQ